jgi:hypothetical protein
MVDLEPRPDDTTPVPSARVKDKEEPTFATYLILRRRLGEIVAQITHSFQRLDETNSASLYRLVEARHADMRAFIASLPRAFDMERPDKSWDNSEWTRDRADQNSPICPCIATIFKPRFCTLPLSFT